jgi:glutathione synthase/RimK-type ligase-like ATP-grasp enzyme
MRRESRRAVILTPMQRIAFLTLEDRAGYVIDDALAIDVLARRGCAVDEVPWQRSDVAWRDYDAVVVRTTWDYQRDLPAFLAAMARIAATGVPLANDLATLRWNSDKSYLRDLARRGVTIVPTRWGEGTSRAELRALCEGHGPRGAVIKPTVSANADDTFRLRPGDPDDALDAIARTFTARAWMAQAFVASVLDPGEFSVFYFAGERSHAIVKRPRPGDFRVQEEHGGIITPITPDAALVRAADDVMQRLAAVPLQARVDLVRLDDGSFALMELEAVEPSLYFRTHPAAADNFADALARWRRGR